MRAPDDDTECEVVAGNDDGWVDLAPSTDPASSRRIAARSGNGAIDLDYGSSH